MAPASSIDSKALRRKERASVGKRFAGGGVVDRDHASHHACGAERDQRADQAKRSRVCADRYADRGAAAGQDDAVAPA